MVKTFNEGANGNLDRCLANLKKFCNDIVVYDDSSTDNTLEVAKKYTSHILTGDNNLKKELFHKQELLDLTLTLSPDWIIHIDPDEIMDSRATNGGIKKLCSFGDEFGFDCYSFNEMNLWRSECWHRIDSEFFIASPTLFKVQLWKNNGKLKFEAKEALHMVQRPAGLLKPLVTNLNIIHYGFSTDELIIRKYKTYKALGQEGWALQRLIDEKTLQLAPVAVNLFDIKPKIGPPPQPLSKEEWDKLLKGDILCQ